MITILDYGAGNLRSVQNTLDELGFAYELVRDSASLVKATKIILPGVGHFGQMMRALDALDVRAALIDRISSGVPFLGICLGMQALYESSEEAPGAHGIAIFPGAVRRFPANARVPHMGWNQIEPVRDSKLVDGRPYVYFAHSYYVAADERTAATCAYAEPFTAVLEWRNVFGVQFHPEKSAAAGLAIVRRFAELAC